MIDCPSQELSIAEQCELLGLGRSSFYYQPAQESSLNLELMAKIDEIATARPYFGSIRHTDELRSLGYDVNRKRISRLMKLMGLEAVYPKPRLSDPNPGHKKYPYLLRGLVFRAPNHVWSTDITYIRMRSGFLYLVAVMDWFSRYVISWKLSNTLDTSFCIDALEQALGVATPEIFNSDQGCQFTSGEFQNVLLNANILISMDGKGRALDNVFTERLWRTVKYEEVYIHDYESGAEAFYGLDRYFRFYNFDRRHSSLNKLTPAQVYLERLAA